LMIARGVVHLVVVEYTIAYVCLMLVIAFTNVSNIYILGKQDYKKS
jgi:hypothetical protein